MKHRLTQLPVMDLKGKAYSEIKERIAFVAANYDYNVKIKKTKFISEIKEWFIEVQVEIFFEGRENAASYYDGTASELHRGRGANQTHALENAYTSAVGTALGKAAIGLPQNGLASFDEVNDAISKQNLAAKYFEAEKTKLADRYADMTWDQYAEKCQNYYAFSVDQMETLRDLWIKLADVDNGLELNVKIDAA